MDRSNTRSVRDTVEVTVTAKVTRRLIPFMFVLYIVAYLDRINVGFAALQMKRELGFSDTVYGLGAGIFFIGYFLFEIPSNLVMERVGARIWIARIMITWGVISSSLMFVKNPFSFYMLRFLLGVAEAGFFPGMILYLTYWFPAAVQARAVARFMTATAIAGVVGGPLSGALLSLDQVSGLAGWQWVFLMEGIPAIILGCVVFGYLTDKPEQAQWLTLGERTWLSERLRQEREQKERQQRFTLLGALSSGKVWLLSLLYLLLIISFYGVTFWLPQVIKDFSGLSDAKVSVISAFPYLAAAVGMVLIGVHSDRSGERRWHVAVPAFTGVLGLLLSAYVHTPIFALLALSLAALGLWGSLGPFWTMPTAFLSGTAAAGGIALINSVGNLGGFLGPYVVGILKSTTMNFEGGLMALAGALFVAGFLALCVPGEARARRKHIP